MSKSKHTPGPWKADNCQFIGTDEEDSQAIAYCDNHRNRRPRSNEESEANAKLIAAAPELLDFVRSVVTQSGGDLSVHQFRDYITLQADKLLTKVGAQ